MQNETIFARLAAFFVQRKRTSIMIIIGTLLLGFTSYTSFLSREGFPAVNLPIAQAAFVYPVGDVDKVQNEIVEPINLKLATLSKIEKYQTVASENQAIIIAQFVEGTTSAEGAGILNEELGSIALPKGVISEYIEIDATKLDGKYDMYISISGDKDYEFLQQEAAKVANEIQKVDGVALAEVRDVLKNRVNPVNGQTFVEQQSVSRVGTKSADGSIEYTNAVDIGIVRKNGTDIIKLSKDVREVVDAQDKNEANDWNVVYKGDFATQIESQISALEENALGGFIAVVLVLFFCINWRAAFVTGIFIPLVLAATFLTLYIIGYSLNVITLFALILVLGLFVDDATVVVEAIDYQKKQGKKSLEAVKAALNDIGAADVAGTLTTLLVFVPMAFTSGILGDFIKPIPITVILAMAISLIFALTIIPFLTDLIISDSSKEGEANKNFVYYIFYGFSDFLDYLSDKLGNFVSFYLSPTRNGRMALVGILIFTVVSIMVGGSFSGKLPFSIFPAPKDSDEIALTISNNNPAGNVTDLDKIARDVETLVEPILAKHTEQVTYTTVSGTSYLMQIKLTSFKSRDTSSLEIIEEVNALFANAGEKNYKLKADIISAGPPAEEFPFKVQIFADNKQELERISNDVAAFLQDRPVDNQDENSEKVIEIKKPFFGVINTLDSKQYVEVAAKIKDATNTGKLSKLQTSFKEYYNEEKIKEIGISADQLKVTFGQESENLESFESAMVALLVAIIIIFCLLVVQYDSFVQAALVFAAVPLTFPLLYPALYLTDNAMSFFVSLGLIGLVGIVVNNTIMLIDFVNQYKTDDISLGEAMAMAVRRRLRPVVTTTSTTVAGLLPLALTDPFWESLGFTIIFGLISSTIFVLITFPAIMFVMEGLRSRIKKYAKWGWFLMAK